MDPTTIARISPLVLELGLGARVEIHDLRSRVEGLNPDDLDEILVAMEARGLIRIDIERRSIRPTIDGFTAFERRCVPELLLSQKYLHEQFNSAVVHIIVSGADGEAGGAGFFCSDYPGYIITARHVVTGRQVLRIMNSADEVIANAPTEVVTGPERLDIALVRCDLPDDVRPFRIEWDKDAVTALDHILIFGYPRIPFHIPAVYCARGEINQITVDYHGQAKIMLACPSRPGCSGGPVVSERGFVVGIMEQENIGQDQTGNHSYISATTAHLVRAIMEPPR